MAVAQTGSNQFWHHKGNGRRPPPPVGWEITVGAKTSTRLLPVPEGSPVSAT